MDLNGKRLCRHGGGAPVLASAERAGLGLPCSANMTTAHSGLTTISLVPRTYRNPSGPQVFLL